MTRADGGRAQRVLADLRALHPSDDVTVRRARATDGTSFGAVPGRAPRVLVPTRNRRAAAAALLRVNQGTSTAQRAAQAGLWLLHRSGLPELFVRDQMTVAADGHDDSLVLLLSEHFGQSVDIALGVGAERANQKPVLQVFDRRGRCLAFAKVGLSPLARELIAAEHDALLRLAHGHHTTFDAPAVEALLSWQGTPVLVLSPLPTPLIRHGSADALPVAPMLEVAEYHGLVPRQVGAISQLQPEPADGSDATAERFHAALARLVDRHGDTELIVGTWHGDWGPWNMAWTRGLLHLWDWERFSTGAPVGFDALHFRLQPTLRRLDRPVDPDALLAKAHSAVASMPVASAQVPALLVTYLATVGRRYVRDAATEHGSALRPHVLRIVDLLESFGAAHRDAAGRAGRAR